MSAVSGVPGRDFTVEDVRGTFPDEIELQPLDRPVDATVRVPGSKSVTNRALLVAALADGTSTIRNPLFSDDPYWLLDALVRLGFDLTVDQAAGEVQVEGRGGVIPNRNVEVYVGNAGTVARFLPPALALGEGDYIVDGVPRMRERPIRDLVDALRRLGAAVEYGDEEGRFPLRIGGGGLRGGETPVRGAGSSQFVSGLLMAAPYAREPVTLLAEGRRRWPYVGLTAGVMRAFGVEPRVDEGFGRLRVEPSVYRAVDFEVEPDASAASYFLAAAAVSGSRVLVPGLGSASPQGDLRFAEVLAEMGCAVRIEEHEIEVKGPEVLRGVAVDMGSFSDTMMTLAAIAPFASGPVEIRGVEHTREQETDRVSAVVTELRRLGVRVEERRDGLRVEPGAVRPAAIRTYGDHRMAMAFAVTGLVASGVRVQDPGCVTKTFPDYFEVLRSLRQAPPGPPEARR